MKKYIVNIEDIGELTTVAALQDSKIFLEKDTKSSFYIAHLEDEVNIPDEIRALEMQKPAKYSTEDKSSDAKKFLDLRLCIEIPQQINKKEVEEILCKEISKTLKTLIRNKESN